MHLTDVKRFLRKLDGIRISQRFSFDTTLNGTKKDRKMKGDFSFSFSLLKGCAAAFAVIAGLAALCSAYKSSVKKKLMKKLKKKYRLVKAGK